MIQPDHFLIPIILLVLTLVFGFWVSRLGKPYNGILFNLHKLAALGSVAAAVTGCLRLPLVSISQLWMVVSLGISAVAVISLFASGALLSAGKMRYTLLRNVHIIATIGLIAAMSMIFYSIFSI